MVAQKTFYLGVSHPDWLEKTSVPLFVSDVTLRDRKSLPRARGIWCLDSGGFSELSLHGTWRQTPREYAQRVRRYADEVGGLQWAAIQDWMCEPAILQKTGLSEQEHQDRTLRSFLALRDLAPELPWIPILQGWSSCAHWRHAEQYEQAGVDLHAYPVVGIGSVCRRQKTLSVGASIAALAKEGLRMHGFGFKRLGLLGASHAHFASADSMAWSYGARHEPPMAGHHEPGPGRPKGHKHCNNCLEYALLWLEGLLEGLPAEWQQGEAPPSLVLPPAALHLPPALHLPQQLGLFAAAE